MPTVSRTSSQPTLSLTSATGIALAACLALALSTRSRAEANDLELRYIQPDDQTKTSSAVVVPAKANLAHTAQILPLNEKGEVVGRDKPEEQIDKVLDLLANSLKEAGSGLDRLVRVNLYGTSPAVLVQAKEALAKRLEGPARPVITVVAGQLAHPDARIALDAIAVTSKEAGPVGPSRPGQRAGAPFAVLPEGAKVYISGQAEQHADLAEATRRTLKSLEKTLAYLGLDRLHVVHVKAFLQPMSDASVFEREMTACFGAGKVPPFSYVEWKSGAKTPIEIELIARAGPRAEAAQLESITPTGMTASPVFSRVVCVNHGDLFYLSGLNGPADAKGTDQVEAIFGTFKEILDAVGSDFEHLAKATYYVTDDEASKALNDLRPRYYNPKLPPAASKAIVPSVGDAKRTVTLDMVGVVKAAKP